MDLTSLYYFTEVAKDLHITRTANRLYISQQTLSNHIQRMEEYYGAKLFYRKPTLKLTCAGEFVLGFAQLVVRENENLKGVLFDVEKQERGLLRFGASTPRSNIFVPKILPAFSQRYPNVEVRSTAAVSSRSEELVLSGDLDFAVVLAGDMDPHLVVTPLMRDQVYLCVSDALLQRHYGEESEALKERALREGAYVTDFARLPFAFMSNRMGDELREQFARAHLTPRVYMTSTYSEIQLPGCIEGRSACFISHMVLSNHLQELPDTINLFPLYRRDDPADSPVSQELVLIRRRDLYLSHYAKFFLELLTDYFENLGQLSIARKV